MLREKLHYKIKLGPEDRESVSLADAMRTVTLNGSYKGIWLHIPNEGKRHVWVGQKMKAMGLIPGSSDYVFIWPGGCLFVELKAGKNKQSTSQSDFQKWVQSCGFEYLLSYNHTEVLERLRLMGAITPR
jgi:hypothetical protein